MRITILDGHPSASSFCAALARQYEDGAADAGHETRRIAVRELDFDATLHRGYDRNQPLEACLAQAQEDIAWCEHLVVVYPVWWGSTPAQLKGFFDRTLLPGFAFKFHEKGPWWDRLLAGRSARMILTAATPRWYGRLAYGDAPVRSLRGMVLGFCGFKPIRVAYFGMAEAVSDHRREGWLAKVHKMGAAGR
ncbi:hypothetical protein Pla175_08720 [Pirellulimonas nuda]|uniref:Flavodoxin-like fold domain-containing protein n=1 Tax=Pirellulimonas nuda TaxID=2528009 RepID=A0A518D7Q7_9BACT|nr:NAD(P)H-dependent oxidoreductase [Pirellulimonas nuda]QDU87510.1 hypothetical protein Pla175_08720 [Pirellulimonas nuda]